MNESAGQAYVYDSEHECDRQERQAVIAGIENHLLHFRVPPHAQILDAGCGSGSMSRLLATRYPDANVTGLDFQPSYVDYARHLAAKNGLANLSFEIGDVQGPPFGDATFDLIWSKYVLYFVPRPGDAIARFRRVTKPGGTVVIALNYTPAFVLDPDEDNLLPTLRRAASGVLDTTLPARLPMMLMRAGFVDISVKMEADATYNVIGAIDPARRRNLTTAMHAARPAIAEALGGEMEADRFLSSWFAHADRPDTIMTLPLWIIQGTVPRD